MTDYHLYSFDLLMFRFKNLKISSILFKSFQFNLIFYFLLSCSYLNTSSASTLSTKVAAGEKLCFYNWVENPNQKLGFYFAVQSGGSFDIDWSVRDPKDNIIIQGQKDRQGDYIFTALHDGEYAFCFDNDMSSFSDKDIDFEIVLENEIKLTSSTKSNPLSEQTNNLEDSIYKLSGSLNSIQRTQKYFRTRENRNFATVQDTQNRIFYFNLGISLLLIGMSFTQVWVVRKFFNSPGKYVRV
ncbi:hypothetical protein O181_047404 [Austropuccinia psidii MF-1]|uniref:GOLD domain-containing protein n=1 Tax=Austropuccinia psidii MF-1 TaxID=1389203 RepID=A0A9Q3DQY5_9BASI|nr:hypothetical protein [Austropuccinia psidii MF-1]